jgi:hypothetical protein
MISIRSGMMEKSGIRARKYEKPIMVWFMSLGSQHPEEAWLPAIRL